MATYSTFTRGDGSSIRVRPFVATDHAFVLSLAPRLVIGIPRWRDPIKWLATTQKWLTDSMARHGAGTMVFVAEDEQGGLQGAASVSHDHHFTGEDQAYIGELAISEDAEGYGVGQALVAACEQWAREQGYPFLVLDTGAANTHARGFYQHLGFLEEGVKLVKLL